MKRPTVDRAVAVLAVMAGCFLFTGLGPAFGEGSGKEVENGPRYEATGPGLITLVYTQKTDLEGRLISTNGISGQLKSEVADKMSSRLSSSRLEAALMLDINPVLSQGRGASVSLSLNLGTDLISIPDGIIRTAELEQEKTAILEKLRAWSHETSSEELRELKSGHELKVSIVEPFDGCNLWSRPEANIVLKSLDTCTGPYHIKTLLVRNGGWELARQRLEGSLRQAGERCIHSIDEREAALKRLDFLRDEVMRHEGEFRLMEKTITQTEEALLSGIPPEEMQSPLLKSRIGELSRARAEVADIQGRLDKQETLYEAFSKRVNGNEITREIMAAAEKRKKLQEQLKGYYPPDTVQAMDMEIKAIDQRIQELKEEENAWKRWLPVYLEESGKDRKKLDSSRETVRRLGILVKEEIKKNTAYEDWKNQKQKSIPELVEKLKQSALKRERAREELQKGEDRFARADWAYVEAEDVLARVQAELLGITEKGLPDVYRITMREAGSSHVVYKAFHDPLKADVVNQLNERIKRLKTISADTGASLKSQRSNHDYAGRELIDAGNKLVSAIRLSSGIQLSLETVFYLIDFLEAGMEGGLLGLAKEATKKIMTDILVPLGFGNQVGFDIALPDNVQEVCDETLSLGSAETAVKRIGVSTTKTTVGKVVKRFSLVAINDKAFDFGAKSLEKYSDNPDMMKTLSSTNQAWEAFFKKCEAVTTLDKHFKSLRSKGWEELGDYLEKRFKAVKDLGWDIGKDVVKDELKQVLANALEGNAMKRVLLKESAYRCERTLLAALSELYYEIKLLLPRLLQQRRDLLQGYDMESGFQVAVSEKFETGKRYEIDAAYTGGGPGLSIDIAIGGEAAGLDKAGRESRIGREVPDNKGTHETVVETFHTFSIVPESPLQDGECGTELKVGY